MIYSVCSTELTITGTLSFCKVKQCTVATSYYKIIFILLSKSCSNGTAFAARTQIAIITNLSIMKFRLLEDVEISEIYRRNFTCPAGKIVSLYIQCSEAIKPDICRIRGCYCDT